MASALVEPEMELFPGRRRWTVQECEELAAEGKLFGRYELLDGEIVSKMGQKPPHSLALTLVMRVFAALLGLDFLRIQSPITLTDETGVFNEPEPDLAVTREPMTAYGDRHPAPEDLRLLIEVADTTLRTDLLVKATLYARTGVPEYWVLDLNDRRLHRHRNPTYDGYTDIQVASETETVALAEFPDRSVLVRDLLPPPAKPDQAEPNA